MDKFNSNKIKELRKQRGITQEQLADSIGVSFQAVSKWENSSTYPDIELLPKIADLVSSGSSSNLDNFNLECEKLEKRKSPVLGEKYLYKLRSLLF